MRVKRWGKCSTMKDKYRGKIWIKPSPSEELDARVHLHTGKDRLLRMSDPSESSNKSTIMVYYNEQRAWLDVRRRLPRKKKFHLLWSVYMQKILNVCLPFPLNMGKKTPRKESSPPIHGLGVYRPSSHMRWDSSAGGKVPQVAPLPSHTHAPALSWAFKWELSLLDVVIPNQDEFWILGK